MYWAQQGGVNCSGLELLYFYHSDYLGSVEFVTDMRGEAYQFFLNSPWGENVENQFARNYTAFSSRFRFNDSQEQSEALIEGSVRSTEWEGQALRNRPVAYFSEGARLPRWRWNFYYGARYYDPKISVWLSVDPLASQAPHLTPYRFSFNNPLNVVDPNGMFETGYDLLSDGTIVELKGAEGAEGGAEFDVLYGTNQLTGKREKMSKQFAKGILGVPVHGNEPSQGDFTSYYIDDEQLATAFFEFAAKSSKSEFSHLRYRGSNKNEGSIVCTSYDAISEWGATYHISHFAADNKNGGSNNVFYWDHSHPAGNNIVKHFGWAGPSGLHWRDHQYPNDLSAASQINPLFLGILLRVYDVSTGGTYVQYNSKGLGAARVIAKKKGLNRNF